jgi:hypothetical protein
VNTSDPTGRYLLGDAVVLADGQSTFVNLLWTNGRLTDFATPWDGTVISAVNSSREMVGHRPGADSTTTLAWRYRNGRFTDLPTLVPGDSAIPVAINARADAVGYEYDLHGGFHAVIWPANRPGTVRELARPATVLSATPQGIDDDGTVVGTGSAAGIFQLSVVWPAHGTPRVLGTPGGATLSGVVGIRNGWVGGWEATSTGSAPVRWNLRTGVAESVDTQSIVYGVNRHGTLAMQGALAHRDRVVTLPGFSTDDARGAKTIADTGVAAGFDNSQGFIQAVIWRGC